MSPKATKKRNKASASSSSKPKRVKNAPQGAIDNEDTKHDVFIIKFDTNKKKGNGFVRKREEFQLGPEMQGVCNYGNTELGWRILREGESAPKLQPPGREV